MAAGLPSDAVSVASVRLRATGDVDVEDLPALSALRRRELVGEGLGVSVSKTPNGRFRARLKSGRVNVASKVFDTKREATAWLARERAALVGGVDPRAGRERVRDAVQRWLLIRSTTVAQKTYRADQDVERLTTASVLNLHLSAVSGREVARVFEHLLASGLVESSVVRYRASLSSFFAWCVRRS